MSKLLKEMKVSERIRQVHNDLVWCEAQENVEFNMNKWVYVRDDGTCSVCIAGAHIYRNNVDKFKGSEGCLDVFYELGKRDLDESIYVQSFNSLRIGNMWSFLEQNGIYRKDMRDYLQSIYESVDLKHHMVGDNCLESYEEPVREDFKNMMLEMADYLESEGY